MLNSRDFGSMTSWSLTALENEKRLLIRRMELLQPDDADYANKARRLVADLQKVENTLQGNSSLHSGNDTSNLASDIHESQDQLMRSPSGLHPGSPPRSPDITEIGGNRRTTDPTRFDSISSSSTAMVVSDDEETSPPAYQLSHKPLSQPDDELEITAVNRAHSNLSSAFPSSTSLSSNGLSDTPRPVLKRTYSSLFESSKKPANAQRQDLASSSSSSNITVTDEIQTVEPGDNPFEFKYYATHYLPFVVPQVQRLAANTIRELLQLYRKSENKLYFLRRNLQDSQSKVASLNRDLSEDSSLSDRTRHANHIDSLTRNIQILRVQGEEEKKNRDELKSMLLQFNYQNPVDPARLAETVRAKFLAQMGSGPTGRRDPSSLFIMDNMMMANQRYNDTATLRADRDQRPEISDAEVHVHIENLLNNIRPDEDVSPEDRTGTPEGLKVNLFEHQKLGLTWLMKMEDNQITRGGILADDMGLGKTVQMIALILTRPSPKPEKGRPAPTLIVAPVALLQQWEREVRNKIKPEFAKRIRVQHSSADKKVLSFKEMCQYDVVITTYRIISGQYQEHFNVKTGDVNPETGGTKKSVRYHSSGFFTNSWHRIILDEAQQIKNRQSLANHACCQLKAEYRWCLSGTPMQNNVEELQSLIQFLNIRPYNDYRTFTRSISVGLKNQSDHALQKLQALLKAILLRRTKDSKIDGKPILQLPPKTIDLDTHLFEGDELAYYKSLEGQIVDKVNKYIDSNTVGQNYSNILTLLLRLRQACCHPMLIARSAQIANQRSALSKEERALPALRQLDAEAVRRVMGEAQNFTCPICMDAIDPSNTVLFLPCAHHVCTECSLQYFEEHGNTDGEGASKTVPCVTCGVKLKEYNRVSYNTFNSVFRNHMTDDEVMRSWADRRKHERIEQKNRKQILESRRQKRLDDIMFENDCDALAEQSSSLVLMDNKSNILKENKSSIVKDEKFKEESEESFKREGNVKRESDDSRLGNTREFHNETIDTKTGISLENDISNHREGTHVEDLPTTRSPVPAKIYNEACEELGMGKLFKKGWASSTKVDACLNLIKKIQIDYPGEKVIVFSQFTSMLTMLEVPLLAENIEYLRYDGGMTASDRNQAVLDFFDTTAQVMLISLKAGNVGLTLTCASHVILMDPFWNPFVEEQAMDRAHRIGQLRPVYVYRVLVKDTVEDRIMELQDKKKKLISAALDEKGFQTLSRLSADDLRYLFMGGQGAAELNGP